jgi:hypothetical protein
MVEIALNLPYKGVNMKLIARLKAYREYLSTLPDYWLLIIGYGWILFVCITLGIILAIFRYDKAAETIIKFGVFFFIGLLMNFVIIAIVRLFSGKKHEDWEEKPKAPPWLR